MPTERTTSLSYWAPTLCFLVSLACSSNSNEPPVIGGTPPVVEKELEADPPKEGQVEQNSNGNTDTLDRAVLDAKVAVVSNTAQQLEPKPQELKEKKVGASSSPLTQPSKPKPTGTSVNNKNTLGAQSPKRSDAKQPTQDSEPDRQTTQSGKSGSALFLKFCKKCHGPDGKAKTFMGKKHEIPDMSSNEWHAKWNQAKIKSITAKGKKGTKMRSFSTKLNADELEAVSAFVTKF